MKQVKHLQTFFQDWHSNLIQIQQQVCIKSHLCYCHRIEVQICFRKVDLLENLTLKGKSDSLFDSAEKDVLLRSLEAVEGNLDSRDYQSLVKKTNTTLESTSHGQDIFGAGVKITKSKGYSNLTSKS